MLRLLDSRSEQSFGKPGKNYPGQAQDSSHSGETAPSSETTPVEELSVQDALASLLSTMKALTTDLNEVKADNQHLHALIARLLYQHSLEVLHLALLLRV